MLTDSKVRQAGFIRNSSSRKIIYNPQPEKKNYERSDDDSFSSFQYQGSSKMSFNSKENPHPINNSREKGRQQVSTKVIKPPSAQIPPKPHKKHQQLQFQNQRLKNNFFQQPQPHPKSKHQPNQNHQQIISSLPRSITPNFQLSHNFAHELEQVQNICNRIQNMNMNVKVMQENFSFNPKMNKLKKQRSLERQQLYGKINKDLVKQSKDIERKPKVNNYFNQPQGNKFQYDFESSSQSDNNEEKEQQRQESSVTSEEDKNYEVMQYYQEQRKKTLPQVTKTQPKSNFSHQTKNYQPHSQGQIYHPQQQKSQLPQQRVQNQQQSSQHEEEQLITDYNKTEFGIKLTEQMRKNKNVQQSMIPEIEQQGVIQKHGGISFQVDVKEFSHSPSAMSNQVTRKPYQQKKKKQVNQKEEILKRRQMAKTYSKQARFRLFGFS